jgi:UDP-N-acetylmuramoylalanine--D-glutamate ligase
MPEFARSRTAILGTGREGQAAWRHLRSQHPEIRLTLVDEAQAGQAFCEQLGDHDELLIGPLSEARLEEFDVLIRSPGISPYRKSIQRAVAAGVVLTSPSNLWFAAHQGENTICVTGTKGKSTTSALLAHMLRACGYRVRLAGNIGQPLLDCEGEDIDWWVIELSSYQLADLEARPTVSLILNLSPEHLDWHGNEDNYRRDKLRLVELAGENPLVTNAADPFLAGKLSKRAGTCWFNDRSGFHVEGNRLFHGKDELDIEMPAGLPGSHNLSNVAAALAVIQNIGADLHAASHSIADFRALSHRLQLLGEQDGIRYIDDSISSAPVATVAALEALPGLNVTLIVGGLDRGVDWTPYMQRIGESLPAAVIALPDNGPAIVACLQAAGVRPRGGMHQVANMAEAVLLAKKLSRQGEVVLLSPGAPSFPHFRDYRDRGCQFAGLCGFEPDETGLER